MPKFIRMSPAQVQSSQFRSVGCLARLALIMANKKELLKSLNAQKQEEKIATTATALEKERQRCRQMSLEELGNQPMTRGKFAPKIVREVYKDIGYVMWIIAHQEANPHFQVLIEYAARKDEINITKESGTSSGDKPHSDEMPTDWEEVTSTHETILVVRNLEKLIHAQSETIQYHKDKIELLEQANQQQQVALYQAMSHIQALQEQIETLREHFGKIEDAMSKKGP